MSWHRGIRRRWSTVGVLLLLTLLRPATAAAAAGLVLSPTHGPPNALISFTGTGFCKTCGPVTVTFATAVVATGVPVGADGTINGQLEVPPSPAGQQQVVATQQGGISATALFFVAPNEPLPSVSPSTTTTPPTSPPTTTTSAPPSSVTTSPPRSPSESRPSSTGPESSAGAAGTSSSGDSSSWWPWVVVVFVLVAVAVGALYLRRRGTGGGPRPAGF